MAALALVAAACARPPAPPPAAGEPRSSADPAAVAELERHVAALPARFPGEGFALVVEPPFVVVGDLPRDELARWAQGTIRGAVACLRRAFFERQPAGPLDVWLFRDAASYERHVPLLFGGAPRTPFGYYSRRHGALVMNIDTGGGTLIHELVHPFVEVDFPDCPAWFDEGLASLYEQCREVDGRLRGLPNWRLPLLQRALERGALPSFRELTGSTREQFYGPGSGLHYAHARYLCYDLQERGLLEDFYRRFRAEHERDASGYATLLAVLGADTEDAYRADWERRTLALRFP